MPVLSRRAALLAVGVSTYLVVTTASAGTCAVPMLEKVDSDHPQCLYFTGTGAYRDKDFATAKY